MGGAYANYFCFHVHDVMPHTAEITQSGDVTILPHEHYANDAERYCNEHIFYFTAAFFKFYFTRAGG